MDPVFANYLGLVARCHFRGKGPGVLFCDPAETRVKWSDISDVPEEVRKELGENDSKSAFIFIQAQDGLVHVARAQEPTLPTIFAMRKVTLVTETEKEMSLLTRTCVEQFNYPSELIEWKVGGDINELIRESTGEYIMHIENGEYYFPDSILYLMNELQKSFSMAGSMSSVVYNPWSDHTFIAFDDHLGTPAMKWGTMMYTREFWKTRSWEDGDSMPHKISKFVEEREHQCSNVPCLDILCFIDRNVEYDLQEVPHVLNDVQRDFVKTCLL